QHEGVAGDRVVGCEGDAGEREHHGRTARPAAQRCGGGDQGRIASDGMAGQAKGPHVKAQPMSPTSHWAILRASPMLQAPSPLTSQTGGWLNDATAHCRRPTSNCAITRAAPIFTTPSPFTSPQTGSGGGVVVVLVVVAVVV